VHRGGGEERDGRQGRGGEDRGTEGEESGGDGTPVCICKFSLE